MEFLRIYLKSELTSFLSNEKNWEQTLVLNVTSDFSKNVKNYWGFHTEVILAERKGSLKALSSDQGIDSTS